MFVAGLRAIAILKDRTSWSVIWRSLCLTIVVLITLYALVWWGLFQISLFETVWIDRIIDVLGGLAVLLLTWMLFPAVVTLVMTIFLEKILRWVEARHYPDLPAPRSQPLMEVLAISAKLTGMTVILQLLIVPLYFFPAVGVPLSFLVNAILLGREYFELVAIRRMDARDLRQLRGRFRLRTLLAGCFHRPVVRRTLCQPPCPHCLVRIHASCLSGSSGAGARVEYEQGGRLIRIVDLETRGHAVDRPTIRSSIVPGDGPRPSGPPAEPALHPPA